MAGDEYMNGELLAPAFGHPLHLDGNLGRKMTGAPFKTSRASAYPYAAARRRPLFTASAIATARSARSGARVSVAAGRNNSMKRSKSPPSSFSRKWGDMKQP